MDFHDLPGMEGQTFVRASCLQALQDARMLGSSVRLSN